MKGWKMEVTKAALLIGATVLTMGACQSIPPEWRISIRGATSAAAGCIDATEDPTLSKRQRIARCTGQILAEGAEVAEAIGELAPESDAPQRVLEPDAIKIKAAPPVELPAVPPSRDAVPSSTAWRARHQRRGAARRHTRLGRRRYA